MNLVDRVSSSNDQVWILSLQMLPRLHVIELPLRNDTVRALCKNNPIFRKGPFCSYSFGAGVLFGQTFKGRTEAGHEEDDDIRDMMGGPSRPFLFLSLGALRSGEGASFLSACSCGRTLTVAYSESKIHFRHLS